MWQVAIQRLANWIGAQTERWPVTENVADGETAAQPVLIIITSDGPVLDEDERDELLGHAFPNLEAVARAWADGRVRVLAFGSEPDELGLLQEAQEASRSGGLDWRKLDITAKVKEHAPDYVQEMVQYVQGRHPRTGVMCTIAVCRPPEPGMREALASLGEEVERLVLELFAIGRNPGYLDEQSEMGRPRRGFNQQLQNVRAHEIGIRLHELGGIKLMEWVWHRVEAGVGHYEARSLGFVWDGVGGWMA